MSVTATILLIVFIVILIAVIIGLVIAFISYRNHTDDVLNKLYAEMKVINDERIVIEDRFRTIAKTFLRLTGRPIETLEDDLQPVKKARRGVR